MRPVPLGNTWGNRLRGSGLHRGPQRSDAAGARWADGFWPTHHHATTRVRAPGSSPAPPPPHRTPALSSRDPGPWWPASPPVQPQPRHQGVWALPGPRLPPWRADGWKAPEAGSQRFAQGLTSATSSSCLGPAPAQACETRPAAPQTRMPPTAPTRHRAQRHPGGSSGSSVQRAWHAHSPARPPPRQATPPPGHPPRQATSLPGQTASRMAAFTCTHPLLPPTSPKLFS